MNEDKTGGPAFPSNTRYVGMDLRDYFAAKAMESMLLLDAPHPSTFAVTAKGAYLMADEMLKERNK